MNFFLPHLWYFYNLILCFFNPGDSFQGENKMKFFIVIALTTIFVCGHSGECKHICKYYIKTLTWRHYLLGRDHGAISIVRRWKSCKDREWSCAKEPYGILTIVSRFKSYAIQIAPWSHLRKNNVWVSDWNIKLNNKKLHIFMR